MPMVRSHQGDWSALAGIKDFFSFSFSRNIGGQKLFLGLGSGTGSGMSQLLLLGKFEYTGGPIFKVVLEC